MHEVLFIVFEGIDGSGTTTQSKLLAQYVEGLGFPVVYTREPGGTPLGERLRALLLDPSEAIHPVTEMLLYAASRAQHVREFITPALLAGKMVICDRFVGSSLAYQGYGRELGQKVVWQVNRLAVGEYLPDLTIYLDLPVDIARKRRLQRAADPDRLEQAGEQLQERVARAYRNIARRHSESALVLDATQSRDALAEEIRRRLRERWPDFPLRRRRGEIE